MARNFCNKIMQLFQKQNQSSKKYSFGQSMILYIHDLAYLIGVMMVLFLFVFRVVVVSGDSMNDTLIDGDYLLLLSNVFYGEPQAGDVVVASKDSFENGVPIVKRVIAVEGQTVDIDFVTNTVYVDGEEIKETYIKPDGPYIYSGERIDFPLTVGKGQVFVLGDNRRVSCDSRNTKVGLLDKREVLGKAIFLFLPGVDTNVNKRDFGRIGGMP